MLAQWKQHCSLVYHLHDNDTTEALLQKVLRISALLELSLGTISVRRRMPYLWASIRFNCEGDTVAIPLCRLSQRALPGALMRSSKLLKRRFMPDNIRGAHQEFHMVNCQDISTQADQKHYLGTISRGSYTRFLHSKLTNEKTSWLWKRLRMVDYVRERNQKTKKRFEIPEVLTQEQH